MYTIRLVLSTLFSQFVLQFLLRLAKPRYGQVLGQRVHLLVHVVVLAGQASL